MKPSIAIAILLIVAASPARAQQADARWAPFVGCWELIDGGATSCVAPNQAGGVTLTTRVNGQSPIEQTIVADGSTSALTESGCSGTQRAEWSRDGRKLFTWADLVCGDQPRRSVSGLAVMTGDSSWIDVRAVNMNSAVNVQVRKYRRAADNRTRPDASAMSSPIGIAPFTIEDVKEINAKLSPAVLEAALAETGARFSLTARELVALDDAGVPGNVIDLMIAMSYPEKFQVERRADAGITAYPPATGPAWWSGYWGLGYPYFYAYPGYAYPGYYVDYALYGYVYPRSYYFYTGPLGATEGSTATAAADGDGRVVNGVGYTRVRTREAVDRSQTDNSSSSSGSSSGRAIMTSSGATQSNAPSPGNSSASGGSEQSDSGRTAQPR